MVTSPIACRTAQVQRSRRRRRFNPGLTKASCAVARPSFSEGKLRDAEAGRTGTQCSEPSFGGTDGHAVVLQTNHSKNERRDAIVASAEHLPSEAELLGTNHLACQEAAPQTGQQQPFIECSREVEQHQSLGKRLLPRRKSRVRFDGTPPIVHEITPYAEIYGMHPRYFVFERDYSLAPAVGSADPAVAGWPWRRLGRKHSEDNESDSDLDDAADADEWDVVYEM